MLKKTLIAFTLSFLSLLGSGWENYAAQPSQKMSDAATGTLQKMIVESGSVTMDLDLNGLNGSSSLVARPVTLHYAAALTVKPTPEEQNEAGTAQCAVLVSLGVHARSGTLVTGRVRPIGGLSECLLQSVRNPRRHVYVPKASLRSRFGG
jgi:hypothetical protein